jgi:hypothetical protein
VIHITPWSDSDQGVAVRILTVCRDDGISQKTCRSRTSARILRGLAATVVATIWRTCRAGALIRSSVWITHPVKVSIVNHSWIVLREDPLG